MHVSVHKINKIITLLIGIKKTYFYFNKIFVLHFKFIKLLVTVSKSFKVLSAIYSSDVSFFFEFSKFCESLNLVWILLKGEFWLAILENYLALFYLIGMFKFSNTHCV